MEPIVKQIAERSKHLAIVSEELKQEFVGLDEIIDRIIFELKAWYLMPELSSRPPIICLWGMTGVGKTDLVRKLVRKLGFSDGYHEIQMGSKPAFSNANSMAGLLEASNLTPGQPGVLLLDEIQRYRTRDSKGEEIADLKYQDVWSLLSDGRLPSIISRETIYRDLLYYESYWETPSLNKTPEEKAKEEKEATEFGTSLAIALRLKRILKLNEELEEILTWTQKKRNSVILEAIENEGLFQPTDYSKLLIFISGNLDEAFVNAKKVSDVDQDADVLHEQTKLVNLLEIKSTLRARFAPEQISRFGNVHVIYPSFSRASYEEMIRRQLARISAETSQVKINFDQSINIFLYQNGVIPSQGVRPLFSTLASYIENNIPKIIVRALITGVKEVTLKHSGEEFLLFSEGKLLESLPARGSIDTLRSEVSLDHKVSTSVHEAGHAILYALLFGVCPTDVKATNITPDYDGFVGLHPITNTPQITKYQTEVLLGGYCAESIVFDDEPSSGSMSDLEKATTLAHLYYSKYGFGEDVSVYHRSDDYPYLLSLDGYAGEKLENAVRSFIHRAKESAIARLRENSFLLIELSQRLIEDGTVSKQEFVKLFDKYGYDIQIVSNQQRLMKNYHELFQKYAAKNFR